MNETQETEWKFGAARWWIVGLSAASTLGSMLYYGLKANGLGGSSAMFLGIPLVLTLALALMPRTKTLVGAVIKGITFALLIVAPLVGEGYLCILMSAPMFYGVGILIALFVDWVRFPKGRGTRLTCVAVLALPMCLEGVVPQLTFDRGQEVQVTQIVAATPDAVERELAQSLKVGTKLPAFLRIGFPRPLQATGEGLEVGDTRTIHFAGAEGDPPGDLVMRVAANGPGYVRFVRVSDGSKLTQWVAWNASEVFWQPVDATHTAVTWRIHFDRELDPAWYFSPWERLAVRDAAGYLIDANATPEPPQ